MLPSRFSHYSIIDKIGEGGMGEVYLAYDAALDRRVVIKVLSAKLAQDALAAKRLIREARAASSLDHTNICTIYEVGEFEGRHFIAMQYVEGQTLDAAAYSQTLGAGQALDIATQLAGALAAAHAKGIIHRDIKPQNIIVNTQGQVKVLDFGLSKQVAADPAAGGGGETQSLLTDRTVIIGTPAYMSPEQVRAEALDARSDIFSYGTVIYELLSGRHPFLRQSTGETLSAVLTFEPPPLRLCAPDVPEKLALIVSRCLDKDKEKRLRNGQELLDELKRPEEGAAARPAGSWLRGKYAAALLVPLLLILLGAALYPLYDQGRRTAPPAAQWRTESLAVLPLEHGGEADGLEYLSDGLVDSLINSFSQLSEVKVIARNSAFRYRGRQIDPAAVGRELRVQALLLGRIVRRDEDITLDMSLVDARDSRHVWGRKYTFRAEDTLRIQEAIAREVYERLRPRPSAQPAGAGPKHYTTDPEAYERYIKGRHFLNKRTEGDIRKGIEFFKQAIDLDPSYALAYTGLADSYALLAYPGYDSLPPAEAKALADAYVSRALEIDDTLAEAHASQAIVRYQFDWDWRRAEEGFRRAIELKPNYSVAHYWYSILLMAQGRREEALAESKKAQELDIISMIANVNIARAHYAARDYDAAVEAARHAVELDDKFFWGHYLLGLSHLQKGAHREAFAALRKCDELSPDHPSSLSALGYAYASTGDRPKALHTLERLKRSSGGKSIQSDLAMVYLGLGDKARALELLERACDARASSMLSLKTEPIYDSLREEPRFRALIARVGLDAR